jgi:hypothetical protein
MNLHYLTLYHNISLCTVTFNMSLKELFLAPMTFLQDIDIFSDN